jgi:hypothetical protein
LEQAGQCRRNHRRNLRKPADGGWISTCQRTAYRVVVGRRLTGIGAAWYLGGLAQATRSIAYNRGLAFAYLFLIACVLSSCGGGSGGNNGTGGTPVGMYNLTVTGTFSSGSTTLTHATKLTLVVK